MRLTNVFWTLPVERLPTYHRQMEGKPPGRPLTPLDPGSSKAAQLGAELRARRQAQGLTLKALGELTGYSIQYASEVERAKTSVSRPFVAACDRALGAEGALLELGQTLSAH